MLIKVKIPIIENTELNSILAYYNTHKAVDDEPLEILDRAEGGFQIQITELKNVRCSNSNEKIKQLRWERRALVPKCGFPYFETNEEELLYDAMKSVLGDNVENTDEINSDTNVRTIIESNIENNVETIIENNVETNDKHKDEHEDELTNLVFLVNVQLAN